MSLNRLHPLQITGLMAIFIAITLGTYALLYKGKEVPDLDSMDVSSVANNIINTYRPDFTLPDMAGNDRSITEWDGKVLVINFWATWCPPCLREIPALIELQDSYGKQGLQLIGIAIDNLDAIKHFSNTAGITFNYPMLISNDAAGSIPINYGNHLGILPYTVIIDRKGNISKVKYGEIDKVEVEIQIKSLI